MSLLSLPGYIGTGFVGLLIACAIAYFGSAITTYLVGFNDDMIVGEKKTEEIKTKEETSSVEKVSAV